jgi:DNA-binding ferritin-like protein
VKDGDVKKIVDHIAWRRKKLQTPAAKSIEKYLAIPISERDAKKIISISSKLASRGIITEKIAKILYEHLNQKQGEKLKKQLNLAYLKKFK